MRHSVIKVQIVTVLCCLWGSFSYAGYRIDFDRDNQTYNWLTSIDYNIYKDRFTFNSFFNGQSNLLKNRLSRWQENAKTGFKSDYKISDMLRITTNGDYTVNGLNKRRVRSSELAAGVMFTPFKFMQVTPLIRASNKNRSEFDKKLDEQGIGYGISSRFIGNVRNLIDMNLVINYDKYGLSNIPLQDGLISYGTEYRFFKADTLALALVGKESTKKYYSSIDSVGRISEQIRQERIGDLLLSFGVFDNLRLRVAGNANLIRFIYKQSNDPLIGNAERDNSGAGESYDISLLGFAKGIAKGEIGYRWGNSRQDYQGLNLDQDTEIGEASFHGSLSPTLSDSLTADIVFGVTSFSNPNDASGRDDWDKKTILIKGQYSHLISRYYSVGLSGGVNSFHQIYVSGINSANNGKNETYILTPYCTWVPYNSLKVTQSFDIQANYITFDFDKKITTKNRIFRRGTARTDIAFQLTEDLQLNQAYYYRYEDYGQLVWDDDDGWLQAVSWDRRRNGLVTGVKYFPASSVMISPNISWEKTADFDHIIDPSSETMIPVELRLLKDEQVKIFLEIGLDINWSANRRISASISHRLRKFSSRPGEINNYGRISMEHLF